MNSPANLKYVMVSFVDIDGILRAKLVPIDHLEDVRREGAGFAGFAVRGVGQGPHHPDMMVRPDLTRLFGLPDRPDVGWSIGNISVEGAAWPYCSRTILSRVLERVRDQNMEVKTGIEAEFFLVRQGEGGVVVADDQDAALKTCYQQGVLSRYLDFLTDAVEALKPLGLDIYQVDHEDAISQFEINWTFDEALLTADRYTFLKFWLRRAAEQQGLIATFMPKPFAHLTGSGAHVHLSLWREGTNLFEEPADRYGQSRLSYAFMAGVLAHAPALTAFVAPTVNSYKRLVSRAGLSGATWAPTTITVGSNNRTHMIRIPGPGRFELRAMDAAVNPYLGLAALVLAGMDGVERNLDIPEVHHENMYAATNQEILARGISRLPGSLDKALDALEADGLFAEGMGREFVAEYVALKREEWEEYHAEISDFEMRRYLRG